MFNLQDGHTAPEDDDDEMPNLYDHHANGDLSAAQLSRTRANVLGNAVRFHVAVARIASFSNVEVEGNNFIPADLLSRPIFRGGVEVGRWDARNYWRYLQPHESMRYYVDDAVMFSRVAGSFFHASGSQNLDVFDPNSGFMAVMRSRRHLILRAIAAIVGKLWS